MSALSAEAHAVIEGRHADPFRYLGPRPFGQGIAHGSVNFLFLLAWQH